MVAPLNDSRAPISNGSVPPPCEPPPHPLLRIGLREKRKRSHPSSTKSDLSVEILKYFTDFEYPAAAAESDTGQGNVHATNGDGETVAGSRVTTNPSAKCLLCSDDHHRIKFKKGDYWNLKVHLEKVSTCNT